MRQSTLTRLDAELARVDQEIDKRRVLLRDRDSTLTEAALLVLQGRRDGLVYVRNLLREEQ